MWFALSDNIISFLLFVYYAQDHRKYGLKHYGKRKKTKRSHLKVNKSR